MKLKKKSKAFTLTELLVVVVVIGVLSAVVLPKFSKVIETRKTTEAEELMGAIRTEQEKRCALDKKYITDDISKLSDIVKNPETKNYTLTLASTGIKATRKDATYNYTLEMPSYADGRICCEDEACARLNKNYPSCTELKKKTDYQASPESCAGDDESVPPPVIPCVGSTRESCGCQKKGMRYRVCDSLTGRWSMWGPCSVSDECECTGTPVTEQGCTASNTCGRETRSADCNTETGKWEYGTWDKSGCAAKPADEVGECPERTRSAVCKNNAWTWGAWTGECADKCDSRLKAACERVGEGEGLTGSWNDETCECSCQEGFRLNAQGYCDCPEGMQVIETLNGKPYKGDQWWGKCGSCNYDVATKNQIGDIDFAIRVCLDDGVGPTGWRDDPWTEGIVEEERRVGGWDEETCSCSCGKDADAGDYYGAVYCYKLHEWRDQGYDLD